LPACGRRMGPCKKDIDKGSACDTRRKKARHLAGLGADTGGPAQAGMPARAARSCKIRAAVSRASPLSSV
jgi:hypothetical protein